METPKRLTVSYLICFQILESDKGFLNISLDVIDNINPSYKEIVEAILTKYASYFKWNDKYQQSIVEYAKRQIVIISINEIRK